MQNPLLKFIEIFISFLLPIAVSLFVVVRSVLLARRNNKIVNWIIALSITLVVIYSNYILGVIYFENAWPTFLPHIGIGVSLIVYLIQYIINKKCPLSATNYSHLG